MSPLAFFRCLRSNSGASKKKKKKKTTNNKDEENSPNSLNDENDQASSQKFKQIKEFWADQHKLIYISSMRI